MRIISGKAKGRALKSVPGSGTRPTGDKVKEAVFSMIGPYFQGGTVLDLFAGTGALGIEALSRGMEKAIFIDMDKKSVHTIRDNLKTAGFADHAQVYCNEATRALKALSKRGIAFDLVFLDPPYCMESIESLVENIVESNIVHNQTTVVLEQASDRELPERIGSFQRTRQADYGSAQIAIYRQTEEG